MKLWFLFEKKWPMSFISHHDTARLFERGFRRAELPLKFSKGYNPQPKLSFASPLPVGVEGEREYGEFELNGEYSSNTLLNNLTSNINSKFPRGIKIKDIKEVNMDSVPKLMSMVEASLYGFDFSKLFSSEELKKAVTYLQESNSLTFNRKSKKGKTKTIDIKPMIYDLHIKNTLLEVLVQTGSKGNVRPGELIFKVLTGLYEDIDYQYIYRVRCTRKEVYCLKEDGMSKRLKLTPVWDFIN